MKLIQFIKLGFQPISPNLPVAESLKITASRMTLLILVSASTMAVVALGIVIFR